MARRLSDKPLGRATRARGQRNRKNVAAPAAGNGNALASGAQATAENLPTFRAVVAEIERIVAEECPWIRPSDMPMVEVFAAEYCIYRHASASLLQMSNASFTKRHRAQGVQVKRLRALTELARDLGLSTAGRAKLGLMVAKTEAIVVKPVRNVERAMEVAQILSHAGALPDLDAEPVVKPEPEPVVVGEVVQLHKVEEATDAPAV